MIQPYQGQSTRPGGLKIFSWYMKLDGVGPVDNRPSTDKLHPFVKKRRRKRRRRIFFWHVICDTWHVTCDMWHMTCDTWHVTCDMWYVTCFGGWTFSQNFRSLVLTVCDLWYYEDLKEKADLLNYWLTQLINDEAVHRTAPATPGLLNMWWC